MTSLEIITPSVRDPGVVIGARRPRGQLRLCDLAEASPCARPATLCAHRSAVERVIAAMVEKADSAFSLHEMAGVAFMSPFHFDRVFRSITGLPPQTFLSLVRMQAAKRLLLTTSLRVSDICYSVGYQSIGTFTARFSDLVGMSPGRFRAVVTLSGHPSDLKSYPAGSLRPVGRGCGGSVTGDVSADPQGGPIFVGLFDSAQTMRMATSCMLTGSNEFHLTRIPDGRYGIRAVAFEASANMRDYLIPDDSHIRVAVGEPVLVGDGHANGRRHLVVRRPTLIDPPIVSAVPALALIRSSQWASGQARARHLTDANVVDRAR